MCNRLLLRLKKISVQFARLERSNHHFYRLSFADVIPSFRIISRIRKQEKLCIMHTNMRTPPHFLGIFGQKTPKKALKIYFDPKMFKIFPVRSLETSKNAIKNISAQKCLKFFREGLLKRPKMQKNFSAPIDV